MAYTNIDDPSAYFQALTYTGNGSHPRNLTNDGNSDLKPDLVWLKNRTDSGTNHVLANSSIGWDAPKGQGYPWENGPFGGQMASNSTGAESTPSATYGYVSAALTDGFTTAAGGTNGDVANANAKEYVAWQWKANGGTTASNTDGTITSTVQANTDAGFSIYTYTGTGAAGTVGHGLGGLPEMIILKGRNTTSDWPVYIDPQKDGSLQFPKLNGTEANIGNSPFTWDTTKFTFSSGSGYSNTSGTNYIAYAFRSIQGYSKIGSYVGNGSANGAFVYTGFKPAFIMIKDTSQATNWEMFDHKRNPSNVANLKLGANLNAAENGSDLGNTSQNNIDMLSNGFKMRTGNTDTNVSGDTYIYMAFAENPLVTSTGVPTTAR